jgi:hypothetical protein
VLGGRLLGADGKKDCRWGRQSLKLGRCRLRTQKFLDLWAGEPQEWDMALERGLVAVVGRAMTASPGVANANDEEVLTA